MLILIGSCVVSYAYSPKPTTDGLLSFCVACALQPETYNLAGADCRFFDSQFAACQQEMKSNLIAATCIASMIATFLMAVFARMPLAVAPAMGVNAYFT